MQSFTDLCLKVYFAEELSPYDTISVNAGLYSLFWDYASTVKMSKDDQERNMTYARLCRDNLETGLAAMPLHISASADAIAALLFGAGPIIRGCRVRPVAYNQLGILFYRVLDILSLLVLVHESI